MKYQAISLKQPWATLLVHGLKTIEVRRWRTLYRGDLLIHAARVPDDRPGVWDKVPEKLREAARQEGGVIGVAKLVECKEYRRAEEFVADVDKHMNDPSWFEETGLFGFRFEEVRQVPFVRVPGNLRLFELELELAQVTPVETKEKGTLSRFQKLARDLPKRTESK